MRSGHHPLVDPREFLEPVVEPTAQDLSRRQVDGPAVQRQRAAPAQQGDVVRPRVLDDIHHDRAAVVVRVEGVEDPARLRLEPAHLRRTAVAAQQADSGLVVRVPGVGQLHPGRGSVHAEGHGQVEENHVFLGQGEVVDHRPVGDGDVGGCDHLAVGGDDDVLDVVPSPEVGDGVQFTGPRVELGVRGESAGQRAAEIARSPGFQFAGQLIWQRAGLHGGQRPSRVPDDVGVGREVGAGVDRALRPGLAERLGHSPGADPPVAVPLGPAVAQPDSVHHPRAYEPVVAGVVQSQRVRPVTQVTAVELGGDAAGDRQVKRGDLALVTGAKEPLEVQEVTSGGYEPS